jgi:hypothetical protein
MPTSMQKHGMGISYGILSALIAVQQLPPPPCTPERPLDPPLIACWCLEGVGAYTSLGSRLAVNLPPGHQDTSAASHAMACIGTSIRTWSSMASACLLPSVGILRDQSGWVKEFPAPCLPLLRSSIFTDGPYCINQSTTALPCYYPVQSHQVVHCSGTQTTIPAHGMVTSAPASLLPSANLPRATLLPPQGSEGM